MEATSGSNQIPPAKPVAVKLPKKRKPKAKANADDAPPEAGDAEGPAVSAEPKAPVDPLSVDLIMENIMGMLPLMELKQCRLVSSNWNQYAKVAIEKLNYCVNFPNSRKLAQYCKMMRKKPNLVFSKFCLKNKFCPRIYARLAEHGPNIKTLSIEVLGPTKSSIHFRHVLTILSSTPNLENLNLEKIDFPFESRDDIPPNPADPVLEMILPKLKNIRINSSFKNGFIRRHFVPDDEGRRIRRVEWIKKLFHACPNLHTLELCSIEFTLGFLQFETFSTILKGLHNLKNLCLERKIEHSDLQIFLAGTTMKLETLRVNQQSMNNNITRCFFPYLKDFDETLKTLDLGISWNSPDAVDASVPHLKNLQDLIIRFDRQGNHTCKLKFAEDIRRSLPKLKRVDVYHANCAILDNIFQYFRCIEELRIHCFSTELCTPVNTLLTGLPDPAYTSNSLAILKPKASQADIDIFLNLTLLAACSSLRDMTNLKILELTSGTENAHITGLTAYFALLKMQQLEFLKLNNVQLTDELKESLMVHHRVVSFS